MLGGITSLRRIIWIIVMHAVNDVVQPFSHTAFSVRNEKCIGGSDIRAASRGAYRAGKIPRPLTPGILASKVPRKA